MLKILKMLLPLLVSKGKHEIKMKFKVMNPKPLAHLSLHILIKSRFL